FHSAPRIPASFHPEYLEVGTYGESVGSVGGKRDACHVGCRHPRMGECLHEPSGRATSIRMRDRAGLVVVPLRYLYGPAHAFAGLHAGDLRHVVPASRNASAVPAHVLTVV